MDIYTIGFTQKSAEEFFELLRGRGIRRVLDVRLRNNAQLAGFSKRDDLAFFLRELCDAAYSHDTSLSPTDNLLDDYRGKRIGWDEYERRFNVLLDERKPERRLNPQDFETPTALLCSEPAAEKCHRRLVADRLARVWPEVTVHHL